MDKSFIESICKDTSDELKTLSALDTSALHNKHKKLITSSIYKKMLRNMKPVTEELEKKLIFPEHSNDSCLKDKLDCFEDFSFDIMETLFSDSSGGCISNTPSKAKTKYDEDKTYNKFSDSSNNTDLGVLVRKNENDSPILNRESVKSQTNTKNNRSSTGAESLYALSQLFLSKVKMFNLNGRLFYYNGKCYDPVSKNDIVRLYRERVDNQMGNEKSLVYINQLESCLLTDPYLYIDQDEDEETELRIAVLNNCIYDVEMMKTFSHTSELHTFSYINANFVKTPSCPNFDIFLKNVCRNDPVLIERMWMIIGYLFMQTNEAKSFFIMGEAPDRGLKNKVCKCIFHDKNDNAKNAVKKGNAEERP